MKLPDINLNSIATLTEAKNVIELLLKAYREQQSQITRLEAEIARLKGQPKKPLFKTAGNTSKSSVTFLLSVKKKWHKKSKGRLPIDQKVTLPEIDTCVCGGETFKLLRSYTKIVQGMLFIRNNVSYHGREKQCLDCGKTHKSILPVELKGISFDPNLRSLISFFKYGCRMTYPLIHRMLTGFGIQISYGEINQILLSNGDKLKSAFTHLQTAGVAKSNFVQSDATGAKRKEKHTGRIINQYIQVISNRLLSIFFITRSYNAKTLNKLLGTIGIQKPFVSDDGSPNGDSCKCKIKQVCWIHEIRHYKKLFPFFNSHHALQEKILTKWQHFYHMSKQYGSDPPITATINKKQKIKNLFDQITNQNTGYDILDKQLSLTRKKKDRLLTFLNHPYLPIQNNQCEQDLRMFVIIRKISGETKSVRGNKSLERHLSIIQTAYKQGLNVFETLHGLLTNQLSPAVLTANIL